MSYQGALDTFMWRLPSVNLLATGQTLLVPNQTGKKLIPRSALIRLVTVTGVIILAPILRLGNNGSFNNIAPLFTVVGAAAESVDLMPIVTTLTTVDIGSTGISLDVQTAGTGSSVLVGDIYLQAFVI